MKTKISFTSLVLTFLCLIAFNSISYAQNGLDPSFGVNGTVTFDFENTTNQESSILKLDNGKILISGNAFVANQEYLTAALYMADGTLDTTFGTNGTILFVIGDMHVESQDSAQDNAGNIYFSGELYNQDYSLVQAFIIKFNENGIIDTSFGANGMVATNFGATNEPYATKILIQSDSKIIIKSTIFTNDTGVGLARYNPNGSLDTSFGVNGYVLTFLDNNIAFWSEDSAILPDGKILVMGRGNNSNGTNDLVVMRYNENGTLDNAFGNNGIKILDIMYIDQYSYLTVQTNGKLILTGNGRNYGANGMSAVLARLNTDGTLDTSFNNVGYVAIELAAASNFGFITSIINGDGSILAVGSDPFYSDLVFFAKYTVDGVFDTSFNSMGLFEFDNGLAIYNQALVNDGKILIAGTKNNVSNGTSYDFYMAQFNLDNFLGIEARTASGSISVYPNPANEFVNITLSNAMTDTQIQIFDVLGKEVISLTTNNDKVEIPIGNLNSGIYFMRVYQNGSVFTEKLIKY